MPDRWNSISALRADWVFPGNRPPVRNGVVAWQDSELIYVGPARGPFQPRDTGRAAILPGLVNPHTHLEFSHLATPFGQPGMSFPDWIMQIVQAQRASVESAEAECEAARLQETRQAGLAECLRAGVTCVGDIARQPWPAAGAAVEPEVTVFRELIGLADQRAEAAYQTAVAFLEQGTRHPTRRPGLSPHAPYTVSWELLQRCVALAKQAGVPVAMHLAESPEELELLASAAGPFVQRLEELAAWVPGTLPRGIRPRDYLELLAHAPRTLVIHGNFLLPDEWDVLAQHADTMSVVYCPGTHAYFGYGRYPLAEMLAAGVRLALGTDSRASSPDLSLLAPMRWVARHHADVEPEKVLRLGTLDAARALGRDHLTGSLEPGKRADLAVVALPAADFSDPYEALWAEDTPLLTTFCRGREVLDPCRNSE